MRWFRFDEWRTAAKVLRLAGDERPEVVVVLLLGLAAAVFESIGLSLFIPLVQLTTGDGSVSPLPVVGPLLRWMGGGEEPGTAQLVGSIVGFLFVGIAVGYLNAVLSNVLAQRLAHRLRVRLFETALGRPLSVVEGLPQGQLVNNLATESWQVCDALFVLINMGIQVVTCLVFLGVLITLSPLYSAVLCLMAVLMGTLVHLATRNVRRLGQESVDANEGFMSYIWDALGGLRVIRGFGRESHERIRFAESSQRIVHVFIRLHVVSGLVGPITQMMTIATVAAILGFALARGEDLGTLVGFLAIAFRLQPRISGVLGARTRLRGLAASVDEVEVALAEVGPESARPLIDFAGLQRGVRFENVSARYPKGERAALNGVSCTFPFGAVTAVAGYSGAGKSTLVALLLRFMSPTTGRILVDGIPLLDIDPVQWNQRVAFVEQNSFLFNASVRENIGYGDFGAGQEAIEAAARTAQADEFIAGLPEGYDTLIGDSGFRLSQGQRQRIALARSLLRRPDVLILDEATNALDAPTERALRAAIEDGRSQRAVIVVAHRRETIESADRVIVLDGGRAVENGTPEELAAAGGVYARLYRDVATADAT